MIGVSVPCHTALAIDLGTTSAHHNHRFEYWGTSLAWWGNEVGGQSNAQGREDLVDIFFDADNGLGMNFVRYNIGAGSNPDTSIQNITRPGAKMEGWVPDAPTSITDTSTWVWDFDADQNQRLILDMAIEHGVSNVEAFANSAPWWMTRNLQSNGISGGGSNLANSNADEFAHYMLEVVEYFQNTQGIHFETIAPMNEPGSGFWNGSSNQEGMGVPTGSFPWQDRMIKTFGGAIDDRDLNIKLVGLEETSTDQSGDSWSDPNLTDEAKDYIAQINTHTYGFNGGSTQSDSERLFDLAQADGKKIYATEYGTGTGATRLARQINLDIRYLDAAGWTYWQAIEDNNGSGWGLAISNFNGNNPNFDVQDQYFAFKQYSAYIRPGSEIIELPDQDNMTAAYDPRTGKTTVVVNNEGADNTSEAYSFDLTDRDVTGTRLIRTTDENNSLRTDAYAALGPAAVNGNNVAFDAVGNAVTSVVIYHRDNLIDNGQFDPNGLPNNSPQFDGWIAEGDVVFNTAAGNASDGTGSAQLQTNATGNTGRIYQTGIGDAETDLTGIAYQLSIDVQFRNSGANNYDADTYLALEFYGADDQTLATVSLEDYETQIEPAFAVKRNGFNSSVDGSDPNDSVYRTYLSGRFVAPEGTRYVRPVVGFDGTTSGSNSVISIDNIRLQEVHPEAAAREWNHTSGGNWNDNAPWLNHADVDNNQHAYFGNAIDQASVITVDDAESIEALTFFSDHAYQLAGTGSLQIGRDAGQGPALIDARWGNHLVSVATELTGDTDVQVLPGIFLLLDAGLDLNGHTLKKIGGGFLLISNGFNLDGGTLSTYATANAFISLGANPILDGDFELLLAPGQDVQLGDAFTLVSYTALSDTFDDIILPSLSSNDWAWEINYGSSLLTATVVEALLAGDYNGSGSVEQGDLDLVLNNWGVDTTTSGVPSGWVQGLPTGSVDQAELDAVLNNWGSSNAPNLRGVVVPEPASAATLLVGLACMRRTRRPA